jgi:hypothetical protein
MPEIKTYRHNPSKVADPSGTLVDTESISLPGNITVDTTGWAAGNYEISVSRAETGQSHSALSAPVALVVQAATTTTTAAATTTTAPGTTYFTENFSTGLGQFTASGGAVWDSQNERVTFTAMGQKITKTGLNIAAPYNKKDGFDVPYVDFSFNTFFYDLPEDDNFTSWSIATHLWSGATKYTVRISQIREEFDIGRVDISFLIDNTQIGSSFSQGSNSIVGLRRPTIRFRGSSGLSVLGLFVSSPGVSAPLPDSFDSIEFECINVDGLTSYIDSVVIE